MSLQKIPSTSRSAKSRDKSAKRPIALSLCPVVWRNYRFSLPRKRWDFCLSNQMSMKIR